MVLMVRPGALASAAETFRLVINPIIYAEVSIRYSRIEDLNGALPPNARGAGTTPVRGRIPRREGFSRLPGSRQRGRGDLHCQTSLSVLTRRSPDIAC